MGPTSAAAFASALGSRCARAPRAYAYLRVSCLSSRRAPTCCITSPPAALALRLRLRHTAAKSQSESGHSRPTPLPAATAARSSGFGPVSASGSTSGSGTLGLTARSGPSPISASPALQPLLHSIGPAARCWRSRSDSSSPGSPTPPAPAPAHSAPPLVADAPAAAPPSPPTLPRHLASRSLAPLPLARAPGVRLQPSPCRCARAAAPVRRVLTRAYAFRASPPAPPPAADTAASPPQTRHLGPPQFGFLLPYLLIDHGLDCGALWVYIAQGVVVALRKTSCSE